MPAKQDAASSIWSGLVDGLEDTLGDSPRISTLEPCVVLDADAREERDLTRAASQTRGDAGRTSVGRPPGE
jgi:hypothetical protein